MDEPRIPKEKWRLNDNFVHGLVGYLALFGLASAAFLLVNGLQIALGETGYVLAMVIVALAGPFCLIACLGIIRRASKGGYPVREPPYTQPY